VVVEVGAPVVSVVIPTYREAENIGALLERLGRVREGSGIELEVLLMDDGSGDGSEERVAAFGARWARMIVRDGARGLSPAVLEGLRAARGEFVVVMDADLSHPPEKIPELIESLRAGREMAVGSRYVRGGSTDERWGLFRKLNSLVATVLARPLTRVRDPMSGFFAMRRADFLRAERLNPIGYKIGLEILVKCGFRDVGEVPIHFADRRAGESKLSVRQQVQYLRHLIRLYRHRLMHRRRRGRRS
jgi:dolichol-phosphate mannosyltransferase